MTYSPLANPTATRAMLERFGLATKHRLGQNFLVDDNVIGNILVLAQLGEGSSVLEVGPGIGTLTLGMLPLAGSVTSIEADRALEPVLADLAHEFGNFRYVMGDALRVSWDEVCAVSAAASGESGGDSGTEAVCESNGAAFGSAGGDFVRAASGEPNILVANLPYNVAATIILKYLSEHPSLKAAVVMVQAEVADRICAAPGTKAYGAYTAKLGLYGHVSGRFEVPPTCFMPAPHVNSAVVRIERWGVGEGPVASALPAAPPSMEGQPVGAPNPAGLPAPTQVASVIDAAFAQRRKTIRNSMAASGFDKAALDVAFPAAGIAPTVRAETLAPADFVRLTAALEA